MIDFASVREDGFSALDIALAESFASIWPDASESALMLAALASWAVGQGHACFDASMPLPAALADERAVASLVDALNAGQWPQAAFIGDGAADCPLVHVGDRIWLRRYWRYEREIEMDLRARCQAQDAPADATALRNALDELLPKTEPYATDWQRIAVALALHSRLTVICGGPGTGKTFTVLRVLALLQRFAVAPLRIALAAPTGKAAQRLSESLRNGLDTLPLSASERASLPTEAMTVHRLLGFHPFSVQPRRDMQHPLDLDVLVVDECSMVDLPLMAKLLRALRPDTRLILLGDPDQLPAVENGAVLATLAACNPDNAFGHDTARWISAAANESVPSHAHRSAISDCVVRLERPRRFGGDSGIAQLVRAIRSGVPQSVFDSLFGSADVSWSETPLRADSSFDAAHFREAFSALLQASNPTEALAALSGFRVLCALREGPQGVSGLNAMIEAALFGVHNAPAFLSGRPILITSNDHALGLFNGDVGVMFSAGRDAPPRVWFTRGDGSLHAFLPAQLPSHESAYAMTVHKAQGSEFDRVELVLPAEPHPLLTREWLYTAASRARLGLHLVAPKSSLIAALEKTTRRINGLNLDRG